LSIDMGLLIKQSISKFGNTRSNSLKYSSKAVTKQTLTPPFSFPLSFSLIF